ALDIACLLQLQRAGKELICLNRTRLCRHTLELAAGEKGEQKQIAKGSKTAHHYSMLNERFERSVQQYYKDPAHVIKTSGPTPDCKGPHCNNMKQSGNQSNICPGFARSIQISPVGSAHKSPPLPGSPRQNIVK